MSDVQITINLPARPVLELKAYGHGNLSGDTKVDRDQGRIVMMLEHNPARTFVETHLLFPTSVTPDCSNVKNITYKEEAERKGTCKDCQRKAQKRTLLQLSCLGVRVFFEFGDSGDSFGRASRKNEETQKLCSLV